MEWKHFKSGSDIRGVALENDRGEAVDLTPAAVERMARAFAARSQLTCNIGCIRNDFYGFNLLGS